MYMNIQYSFRDGHGWRWSWYESSNVPIAGCSKAQGRSAELHNGQETLQAREAKAIGFTFLRLETATDTAVTTKSWNLQVIAANCNGMF